MLGVILLCYPIHALTQNLAIPGYNHWTKYAVEEGLISSEVHCLLQDRDGYLWIGTDQGLCSFDSEEWTYYTPANGLQDGMLVELKEDADGNIWFKGLNHTIGYIEKKSGRAKTPGFNATLKLQVNHRHALKWELDPKGNGYIYVYEFANDRIQRPYSLTLHQIKDFQVADTVDIRPSRYQFLHKKDHSQHTWIYDRFSTRLSVEATAGDSSEFEGLQTGLKLPGKSSSVTLRDEPEFFALSSSHLLIAINNLLIVADKNTGRVVSADTLKHDVANCRVDNLGRIWIGLKHKGGLLIYPSQDLSQKPVRYLNGLTVSSFCEDRSGALWIGTTEIGVLFFSNSVFQELPSPSGQQKLTGIKDHNKEIYAIYGGKKGYRVNHENESWSFEHLMDGKRLSDIWCDDDTCYSCQIHHDGQKQLVRWTMNPVSSVVWSSQGAFNHFSPVNRDELFAYSNIQWAFIKKNEGSFNGISLNQGIYLRVNNAIHWDTDTVLIASNSGLKKVTTKGQTDFMTEVIGKGHIYDVAVDPWDHLWIATKGYGVYCASKSGRIITQYTIENGLPRNAIYDLELTTDSQLYGATQAGLFQIDVSTKQHEKHKIQTWNKAQGLHSLDLKQLASTDEHLFLNVANTTVWAQLESLRQEVKYPSLRIKEIRVNDKPRTPSEIKRLRADENNVSIRFGGFHFGSKKPRYWYSLNQGKSWISTQDQELNLLDINPGEYEVMIATQPNYRPGKDVQVSFQIAQPFTKSPLFILLVFLVGGALVFFILWTFLSRERLERKIVQSRQQALSSQMNPHFIFNALNSIYYFVGKGKKGEVQSYIGEFAFLMRQVLNASREGEITLDKELDALKAYLELEELRFRVAHEIKVVVEDDIVSRLAAIKIPAMILQPFLENAIEHGLFPKEEPGYLLFQLSASPSELHVIIEDNGVGRQYSKKMTKPDDEPSHGMAITEERIALVNKKSSRKIRYSIADVSPSGTRINLIIPI